jgi:membrane fusion protein (multidrug efflux system)
VLETQGIFNVMVVGADGIVEQRPVTPAERVGSLWAITSGLNAGDKVIVEGLLKVRPKMKVNAQEVAIEEKQEKKEEASATAANAPAAEGAKQ